MEKKLEKEVKIIAKKEAEIIVKDYLEEISQDMKEIKNALLGNKAYRRKGIIEQVKDNTDYIERNETLKIAERGASALEWWEEFVGKNNKHKKSKVVLLDEMLSAYSNIKWAWGVLVAMGLINLPQAIKVLIELFDLI